MKKPKLANFNTARLKALLVSVIFLGTGMERGASELPMLQEQPWLSYFVGFANKNFRFAFSSEGGITLTPLVKEAELTSIPITFYIEETLPDGKTKAHQFRPGTLESAQSPSAELKSAVVRGLCNTDSSFELYLDQTSGVISMGGACHKSRFIENESAPLCHRDHFLSLLRHTEQKRLG